MKIKNITDILGFKYLTIADIDHSMYSEGCHVMVYNHDNVYIDSIFDSAEKVLQLTIRINSETLHYHHPDAVSAYTDYCQAHNLEILNNNFSTEQEVLWQVEHVSRYGKISPYEPLTLRLPTELYNELFAYSEQTGVSIDECIGKLIQAHITKEDVESIKGIF